MGALYYNIIVELCERFSKKPTKRIMYFSIFKLSLYVHNNIMFYLQLYTFSEVLLLMKLHYNAVVNEF